MIYQESIERIISELTERKEDLLEEQRNLPDGELFCSSRGDKKYYYCRLKATGNRKKERRYGITTKQEIIHGLVRKEYIAEALKCIDNDIKALQHAEKHYKPVDENSVMAGFLKKNPELSGEIYRKNVDLNEWKSRFKPMDDFHPENLRSRTSNNLKTRSNAELYIASRLDHFGLVYRHDCPTGIPGLYRYPDFQILRPRDYEVIYWEHFGMMDDMEYRIDYHRKMEEYDAHGIVPWKNLITTFGYSGSGIDGKMIDSLIQGWLL